MTDRSEDRRHDLAHPTVHSEGKRPWQSPYVILAETVRGQTNTNIPNPTPADVFSFYINS